MTNTMRICLMNGRKKIAEKDFEMHNAPMYIVHDAQMYRRSRQNPPSNLNGYNGNALFTPITEVMHWDEPLGPNTAQKETP